MSDPDPTAENSKAIFSNIPFDSSHQLVQPSPGAGLLKALRVHRGLTLTQVGRRAGLSKQRIAQIENAETKNSGFVSTYQRLAETMDYDAVLILVPRHPVHIDDAQTLPQVQP
jgi:DNA-binding XRE family transcriptional regulator